MQRRSALEQSLRLLDAPDKAVELRAASLPDDVGILLHILAGDVDWIAAAAASMDRPAETAVRAAEQYARLVFFAPGADAYSALAASPLSSRSELRANLALLLRWLHPDHRQSEESMIWFDRVMQAWRILESSGLRREYDRRFLVARSRQPALSAGRTLARAPFFATTREGCRAAGTKRRSWRIAGQSAGMALLLMLCLWFVLALQQ